MGHALDALCRLETLAEAGATPDEVAQDAALIAAGWWWDARGDLASDRLVLLVQELRRWCAAASSRYALRWDKLERAERPKPGGSGPTPSRGAGPGQPRPARVRVIVGQRLSRFLAHAPAPRTPMGKRAARATSQASSETNSGNLGGQTAA